MNGHEVRVVADGAEALSRLEDFRADIVLLDIGLPRMDGFMVAHAIRARFANLHLRPRLLALTGHGREEDRHSALRSGFDGYLTKPLEPASLLRMIADEGMWQVTPSLNSAMPKPTLCRARRHSESQFGTWLTLNYPLTALCGIDALIECNSDVSPDARTTHASRTAPFRRSAPVAWKFRTAAGCATPQTRKPCGCDRLVSPAVAGGRHPDPAPLRCRRVADADPDLPRRRRDQPLHGSAGAAAPATRLRAGSSA